MTDEDRDRDAKIADMMIAIGGSFVKALGRAFRLADPDNARRLTTAFPDYFEKYVALIDVPLCQTCRHPETRHINRVCLLPGCNCDSGGQTA